MMERNKEFKSDIQGRVVRRPNRKWSVVKMTPEWGDDLGNAELRHPEARMSYNGMMRLAPCLREESAHLNEQESGGGESTAPIQIGRLCSFQ
jgi:hypothetical protein